MPKSGPTMIRTFVKVGSMNETDRLKGISHYIEHNLFNGSKNLAPNEFVEIVNRMGAEYNASTGHYSTDYYIKSPLHTSQDLEKLISLHANMLQYPKFYPQSLDKEKGPVISEIHMYQDSPDNTANNVMIKNLFNIHSPVQDLIAGSEENVRNLTRQDVVDYYNTWYTPDNMTTVVVGDVNSDQAIRAISKYFNTKPSQKPAQDNKDKYYCTFNNPIQQTKRVDIKNPNLQSASVNMAFVGPANADIKECYSVDALSCALTGYNNARLTQALKKFNTEALMSRDVLSPNLNDPQIIALKACFKPGDEEKGLKAFYSSLFDIVSRPPDETEMLIIKNKLKDNFASASESSRAITSFIGDSILNHGDFKAYSEGLKIIDSLTPLDIQNSAKKYLDLNKASIVVMHPDNQAISIEQYKKAWQPDINLTSSQKVAFAGRQKKLSFGSQPHNFKLDKITEYDLSNNIHLAINDTPQSIRTASKLEFKTGIIPMIKPGVVDILAFMLTDGTKTYTKEQLSEICDKNNIRIGADTGHSSISVNASSNADGIPLCLKLIKEVLFDPDFTEEKFNRAKEEIKINYLSSQKMPQSRAIEALYGDHPLGYSEEKSLKILIK